MTIRTLHPQTRPRSVILDLIVSILSSWHESNLLRPIFDIAEFSFCRNPLSNKQINCFGSIGLPSIIGGPKV